MMAKYAAEADRGILYAFPLGESCGTRNMIRTAEQFGLEINVIEQKFDDTSELERLRMGVRI